MDAPTKPTAAQLIKKYLEIRDTVTALTKDYDKQVSSHKDNMQLIEGVLAEEINRLEGQSIKTEFGTAYRSTVTSFRVADRSAWLNWVFENDERDMLTTHVAKDAVKEYIDETKAVPPGLDIATLHKINIRSNT